MSGSSTTAEEKGRLRRQVRSQLSGLSPEALQESDRALFASFLSLPQVQSARTLFLFWGIPGREPETESLVRTLTAQGKQVGLPRMLPGHRMEVRLFQPDTPMVQASFGIWEPSEAAPLLAREAIELALVPAVCYDRERYRLGFGGGYYDRWLEGFSGFTVGLCREPILQAQVPREAHDQRVALLLTERRTFTGGEGSNGKKRG